MKTGSGEIWGKDDERSEEIWGEEDERVKTGECGDMGEG